MRVETICGERTRRLERNIERKTVEMIRERRKIRIQKIQRI